MQTTYDNGRSHGRNVFAWVVVTLAALAVLMFAAMAFFHPYTYTPGMGYYPYFGWGFFPFGFIFFIAFIFFIFRWAFWGWGGGWGHRYSYRYGYGGDAKDILRQRYARGEITKEQFDQMMRDLDQHS
ncbi:MAG: SHOCT domain-containing protein [Nitrososphaerota archaeon]|nr:SHOCT domain-containing protein [Nitrososphaerota archaeon]